MYQEPQPIHPSPTPCYPSLDTEPLSEAPPVEHEPPCLTRTEQQVVDDLAVTMIDPDIHEAVLADHIVFSATILGCTPAQAAAIGAKVAASVLSHTPRYDDGADGAFDLDYVREALNRVSDESAPLRPDSWGVSIYPQLFRGASDDN